MPQAMQLDIGTRFALNDGNRIPVLGLGVFEVPSGRVAQDTVSTALAEGYRHVDTAKYYRNEKDVGMAIRASGLPRADVFVTSKLWNDDHGTERALGAGRKSCRQLGLGHIDLYLIHWPVAGLRGKSWDALVRLREEGVARSIGVSNYRVPHLEELLASSSTVPAVNQVEFHPFLYQKELLRFCQRHGIQLEAYAPLTKGERLRDPKLIEIAAKVGRTPAQVLLRWALQHEVVVIPRSVRPERIRENRQIFDFHISSKEMDALDRLDEGFRTDWNPDKEP